MKIQDGDGDLDAFVANWDGQSNQVWFNRGNGTFTLGPQTLGNGDSAGIVLGDLDLDGDLDAYVANFGALNEVWMNDGTGVFTRNLNSAGSDSNGVVLGDIDRDGTLDPLTIGSEVTIIYHNHCTGDCPLRGPIAGDGEDGGEDGEQNDDDDDSNDGELAIILGIIFGVIGFFSLCLVAVIIGYLMMQKGEEQ
ncbi:VCBS repeat-containing protein [Balamuthia mandrillaris]